MTAEKRAVNAGKKGQSANEAAVLITIMTFFLIVAMAAISDDIITASDNNYKNMLTEVADVIEQEAMIAFSSENGYYHAFNLPQSLNGQPYSVGFLNSTAIGSQANSSMLFVSSENTNIPLNVTRLLPKDVRGNLIIGRVSIKKEKGLVIINSRPFPPLIYAITPSSGTIYGSTPVTITGANFASTPGVSFGGVAATGVALLNQFRLQALTPAHAPGAVDVTVTNPDGQSDTLSNGYNYISPPPSVTGVSPSSGPAAGGAIVTITGSNFVSGASVSFGGVASSSVTFVSSSQLTAVAPANSAGVVDVAVTNPDGQSGMLSNGFTYDVRPPPSVTGVSPSSGSTIGGTVVTVTGSNFVVTPTVTFGGTAAPVTFVSSSQLVGLSPPMPAGTGAVVLNVINPDGQSASSTFTYYAPYANGAPCAEASQCSSRNCVDDVCCNTACTGNTCQRCDSYSSAGAGTCGYVSSSSQDPDNNCGTLPEGYCSTGSCSGTSYSCGYLTSGEQGCPVCRTCTGAISGNCVNFAGGSRDTEGSIQCAAANYRCNGGGVCEAPITYGPSAPFSANQANSAILNSACVSSGYDGYDNLLQCLSLDTACDALSGCNADCGFTGPSCWRFQFAWPLACNTAPCCWVASCWKFVYD